MAVAGQPPTIIDAPASETVRNGSQKVQFSTAGNLIAEGIEYNKTMKRVEVPDTFGKPDKAAYIPEIGTGRMTVQLKSSTSQISVGETVQFLNTNPATLITCWVVGVGLQFSQAGATKVSVEISEKLNG